jgi:Mrp family chromosome partitioning ATPase
MGSNKNIKHVIAVASGKGGVGKSSVTCLVAVSLARQGFKVGIMDADVTGPSIPKLLGLNGHPEREGDYLVPLKTELGIKIMSLNLLLEQADQPVIWRGPIISKVVIQFWEEIAWGDLDYLVIDLPPGTGDVPLTVLQSIPVEGIMMVTTPQDLAGMVVSKAINMAKKMEIPIIGLIENMSYLVCPDCGKRIEVFGSSKVETMGEKYGIKVLGRIPLDPNLVKLSDQGQIEKYESLSLFNNINNFLAE